MGLFPTIAITTQLPYPGLSTTFEDLKHDGASSVKVGRENINIGREVATRLAIVSSLLLYM